MQKIFFHIGHNKTGSTFLQSTFEANRETLQRNGILYPLRGQDVSDPATDLDVMTPTGNAMGVLDSSEKFARFLKSFAANHKGNVLLSSETLFDRMLVLENLSFLKEAAAAYGYQDLRVLLFTRNPVSHGSSRWQQRVKGWQGETRAIDEYFADDYDYPARVRNVVRKLEDAQVRITIRNYSSRKKELLHCARAWLGLSENVSLLEPAQTTINRSLTRGEVELQRTINHHLGSSGEVFAFHMANSFADAPRQTMAPSKAAQRQALKRLATDIDALNRKLDTVDHYEFDFVDVVHASEVVFSLEQLQVIGDRIGAALAEGRKRRRIDRPLRWGAQLLRRARNKLRGLSVR